MITLCIRYTIDQNQYRNFEENTRANCRNRSAGVEANVSATSCLRNSPGRRTQLSL
jgi:hypothetical protein